LDTKDQYSIYLTVTKAGLKRDMKQRFFRGSHSVDTIELERDLQAMQISLPMQCSQWNLEKVDFLVRSCKILADKHMPVRKYTKREDKLN